MSFQVILLHKKKGAYRAQRRRVAGIFSGREERGEGGEAREVVGGLGGVAGALHQDRLEARRARRLRLLQNVRREEELARGQPQRARDGAVALGLALGAGAGVEVTTEKHSQISVARVAEEQLLRLDAPRGVDRHRHARRRPGPQRQRHVVKDLPLERAAGVARRPDAPLELLERRGLTILVHLPERVRDQALQRAVPFGDRAGRQRRRVLREERPQRLHLVAPPARPQPLAQARPRIREQHVIHERDRRRRPLDVQQDRAIGGQHPVHLLDFIWHLRARRAILLRDILQERVNVLARAARGRGAVQGADVRLGQVQLRRHDHVVERLGGRRDRLVLVLGDGRGRAAVERVQAAVEAEAQRLAVLLHPEREAVVLGAQARRAQERVGDALGERGAVVLDLDREREVEEAEGRGEVLQRLVPQLIARGEVAPSARGLAAHRGDAGAQEDLGGGELLERLDGAGLGLGVVAAGQSGLGLQGQEVTLGLGAVLLGAGLLEELQRDPRPQDVDEAALEPDLDVDDAREVGADHLDQLGAPGQEAHGAALDRPGFDLQRAAPHVGREALEERARGLLLLDGRDAHLERRPEEERAGDLDLARVRGGAARAVRVLVDAAPDARGVLAVPQRQQKRRHARVHAGLVLLVGVWLAPHALLLRLLERPQRLADAPLQEVDHREAAPGRAVAVVGELGGAHIIALGLVVAQHHHRRLAGVGPRDLKVGEALGHREAGVIRGDAAAALELQRAEAVHGAELLVRVLGGEPLVNLSQRVVPALQLDQRPDVVRGARPQEAVADLHRLQLLLALVHAGGDGDLLEDDPQEPIAPLLRLGL
jgi:hypothetical protein